MAGTAGAGDVFRGAYEGSIIGSNMDIARRPYHKNCSCALHGSGAGRCTYHHKPTKISYPIRRSWSEGSFALYAAGAAAGSSSSHNSSPSSSPAVDLNHQNHNVIGNITNHHHKLHHQSSLNIANNHGDDLFPRL